MTETFALRRHHGRSARTGHAKARMPVVRGRSFLVGTRGVAGLVAVSGRVTQARKRSGLWRFAWGATGLPRRIDRRSGLSRAMDRPASAGPAVGRRDRTDRASSSNGCGKIGQGTADVCDTRRLCC